MHNRPLLPVTVLDHRSTVILWAGDGADLPLLLKEKNALCAPHLKDGCFGWAMCAMLIFLPRVN